MTVRISEHVLGEAERLIAGIRQSDCPLAYMAGADRMKTSLRLDAQLAYLDGRTARARALNKLADRLSRAVADISND